MNYEQSLIVGLRRHFVRNVLTPMVAVVLFSLMGCGLTAWFVTMQSNTNAREKQQQVIENVFAQHLADYHLQHLKLLQWERLPAELNAQHQETQPVGHWLYTLAGDDEVYLLDANNHPLDVWLAGEKVTAGRFIEVQRQLTPWLTRLDRLTSLQNPTPFLSDFIRFNGRVGELAVGIVPGTSGQKLIFIRYLHKNFVDFLENRGVVNAFSFTPSSPTLPNSAGFLLKSQVGIPVSYVSWQPMLPGSHMLMVTGPLVAVAVFAITLMCILMTRRLWQSSRKLTLSMARLEASEAHAQRLVLQDILTGLPNRAAMEEELSRRLGTLPETGECVALLLLDLDRFKMINDTHGHHTGDQLLIEVGERLTTLMQQGHAVARLGGDEFVVIVDHLRDNEQIAELCRRIISKLTAPVMLQGNRLWVGVSIGIALAPRHGREKQELMRKADIALYAAKSSGGSRYHLFDPALGEAIQKRQQLAEELRLALENGEGLALWYQPIMDISGRRILAIESLMRWHHPVRGAISPADFIPIAEETGLIIPLGDWVLDQACAMAGKCPMLLLAVNVSPLQFLARDFIDNLTATLHRHGIDPQQIELEITEGVLLEDEQQALHTIQTLRGKGYRIALDDFGTGYSSLNYLTQFPVDTLKIDRSFIRLLGIQPHATTIVETVIRLGHSLGLKVTAEGVETEQQREILEQTACDRLQGFLLSHPQPAEKLLANLKNAPDPQLAS